MYKIVKKILPQVCQKFKKFDKNSIKVTGNTTYFTIPIRTAIMQSNESILSGTFATLLTLRKFSKGGSKNHSSHSYMKTLFYKFLSASFDEMNNLTTQRATIKISKKIFTRDNHHRATRILIILTNLLTFSNSSTKNVPAPEGKKDTPSISDNDRTTDD